MATAYDNFTDTAATLLNSHTADTGQTWASAPSNSGNMFIYTNGVELQSRGDGTDSHYSSFVPATAEYDVTISLSNTASGTLSVVASFRQSTSVDTVYRGFWNGYGPYWELRRIVAGSSTTLATAGGNSPVGTTGNLKFEGRDATKKLFWGATELLSNTDNTITAAGRPGVRGGDAGSSRITYWEAVDVAGGGTGNPWNYYAQC